MTARWQWFPWRRALDLLYFISIRHLKFHNFTALHSSGDWQGFVLSHPTLEGGYLVMSGDVLVFITRGERMLLPCNGERPGTMQISHRVCSVRYCLAPCGRDAKVEEPNYMRSLDCSCCSHAQGNIRVVLFSVKEISKAWDCRCLDYLFKFHFLLCIWCFAWMSIYASRVCLVPSEIRRRCWSPWN